MKRGAEKCVCYIVLYNFSFMALDPKPNLSKAIGICCDLQMDQK